MCMLLTVGAAVAQNLIEDLSNDEVTIVFKNANDQSVSKGEHKQSGRMINYDPGKSITIVTAKGDTLTYLQEQIYRIKRKRPFNTAFTSEFDVSGPQRGYHGEYSFDLLARGNPNPFGCSTVQAWQLLPWLRLGVGYTYLHTNVDISINEKRSYNYHALYGQAKVFFTRSLFNPFVDVRLGSSLNKNVGFHYDASVGCRFGFKSTTHFGINFSMGVTNAISRTKNENRPILSLRLGFEF